MLIVVWSTQWVAGWWSGNVVPPLPDNQPAALFRRGEYTGRFIMFSVITNIYITRKPKYLPYWNCSQSQENWNFFEQLEMFDVCTTGDTAHIDTIFKFLPHTRQQGCHGYSSLLQLFIPRTNGLVCRRVLWVLWTKCTSQSNHRLTGVIFQHTKRLLPRSGHFLTT
jgi:hypothetical protein